MDLFCFPFNQFQFLSSSGHVPHGKPARLLFAHQNDDDDIKNTVEQLKKRAQKTEQVHHLNKDIENKKQTIQKLLDKALEEGNEKRAELLIQQIERLDAGKSITDKKAEKKEDITDEMKAKSQKKSDASLKELSEVGTKLKLTAESIKKEGEKDPAQMGKIVTSMQDLSELDGENNGRIKAKLKQLQEEKKLTEEESKAVYYYRLGEKDSDSYKNFQKLLKKSGKLVEKDIVSLLSLKEEEESIDQQATELLRQGRDIIDRNYEEVYKEAQFQAELEQIRRGCGINVKKGTTLVYDTLEYNDKDEILKHLKKEVIVDIRRRKKGDEGRDTDVFIVLSDGSIFTSTQFIKWVYAQDVTEKIPSKKDLQEKLNAYFNEFDIKLEVGQKFETQKLIRQNGELIEIPEVVTITEINAENIKLDKPVVLRPASFTDGLASDEEKAYLSHGEFLRWMIANQALPHYNTLDQLRFGLRRLNHARNKNLDRKSEEFPPIQVNPQEILYQNDGSGRKISIVDVDKEKGTVSLSNGKILGPTAFLAWVRDQGVEKYSKEVEKLKADKIADTLFAKTEKEGEENKPLHEETKKVEESEEKATHEPPKHPKPGAIEKIWRQTRFLSIMDVYRMAKMIYDFFARKEERHSKDRYASLGKMMKGPLGTEFLRLHQAAENEEVNQYKEAFEQLGTDEILEILHRTSSKDETKACFTALVHRGQIRWDDKDMWATLNRIAKGEPNWIDREDDCEPVINALWGKDQYRQWEQENDHSYNNSRNSFQETAKKLEGDPKGTEGLGGELRHMLHEWKEGRYVDPTKYEAMVYYAIKAGKLSFNDKLFFIIQGIGYKNKYNRTLLHIDRVSNFDGELLNAFPVLDFFTDKSKRPGKPGGGGWSVEDYEGWIKKYCDPDAAIDPLKPGPTFNKFVNDEILMNDNFKTRLRKAANKAEWDHDDMHIFGPFLQEADVDVITTSAGGGGTSKITKEGFKNVYAGFNDHIKRQSEELAKLDLQSPENQEQFQQRLRNIVDFTRSFIRFDGIMSERMYHADANRIRITPRDTKEFCVVDGSRAIGKHIQETRTFLNGLIDELGDPALKAKRDQAYTPPASKFDQGKMKSQEEAFKSLGRDVEIAIQNLITTPDGKEKLQDIIRKQTPVLVGISEAPTEAERERIRKESEKQRLELEGPDIPTQKRVLEEYDQVVQATPRNLTEDQLKTEREGQIGQIADKMRQNMTKTSGFLSVSAEELQRISNWIQQQRRGKQMDIWGEAA